MDLKNGNLELNLNEKLKMVNNFEIIKKMLTFVDKGDFYFLQILQRKKDNPEIGSNLRVIKTYYIKSVDELVKRYDEIKKLCKLFNARAYINLNKRNFVNMYFKTIKLISDQAENGNYDKIPHAFDSVCGKYHSTTDKKWIVDIDFKNIDKGNLSFNDWLNLLIGEINKCRPEGDKILAQIPTLNGIHLITKPFDKSAFGLSRFLDIHKNNPTILYAL